MTFPYLPPPSLLTHSALGLVLPEDLCMGCPLLLLLSLPGSAHCYNPLTPTTFKTIIPLHPLSSLLPHTYLLPSPHSGRVVLSLLDSMFYPPEPEKPQAHTWHCMHHAGRVPFTKLPDDRIKHRGPHGCSTACTDAETRGCWAACCCRKEMTGDFASLSKTPGACGRNHTCLAATHTRRASPVPTLPQFSQLERSGVCPKPHPISE